MTLISVSVSVNEASSSFILFRVVLTPSKWFIFLKFLAERPQSRCLTKGMKITGNIESVI